MNQFIVKGGDPARPLLDSDGEIVNIDRVHHEVHEGCMYDFHAEDLDLDNTENLDTLIITGAKSVHITIDAEAAGGRVPAFIYEGTTVSANGTAIAVRNRKPSSANTALTTVFAGPTITALGTEIVKRQILASSQGAAKISSAIRAGVERILKPNTAYLLRQTSTADNTVVTVDAIFYEE